LNITDLFTSTTPDQSIVRSPPSTSLTILWSLTNLSSSTSTGPLP